MPNLSELPKKYPKLFKSDTFYFECGNGWFTLLDCLLNLINHTLKRNGEVVEIRQKMEDKGESIPSWIREYFEKNPYDPLTNFNICQIKEKFGGLRFYWGCDVDSEEIQRLHGAVELAESLSFSICEECGNTASETKAPKGSGWVRTLCEPHHRARQAEIDARNQGGN